MIAEDRTNFLIPVETIHEASLELLEEIGVELMGSSARAAFGSAGALVDGETGLARIPREVVLADVGDFKGGQALTVESSDPLSIAAMALRKDRRFRLLLANLGPDPCAITLPNAPPLNRSRKLTLLSN